MTIIQDLFGKSKAIIAMAHLPALPGYPLYDEKGGIDAIRDRVARDVSVLAASGVDAVLFCNENDRPYSAIAGPEVVAAMTAVVTSVAADLDIPFGVDVLWDPQAAISIAHATGARFVREVFTGVYASEMGLWNTDPNAALKLRRNIGADVKCFFNITAEFAAPLAARPIGKVAHSAVFSSLADGILVSGSATGVAVDLAEVREAKLAVPDTAVLVNTGVRAETIADILQVADGVLVGSSLKRDGNTWNEVDPARVARFVEAAAGDLWQPRTAVPLLTR
ncbi:BtpA/SgcQ family protein [Agromyces aerolatus]|uniref:BtpA/SgcQ family protein n=1 Tax=Agromyces sp. LY-1074 TaxID=3074080 RepID=UPI0028619964|nr:MULTISPECIES: BtpA/SgcQ family protein [unclassified Agromyces]MDR5701374.1 BtpA/SgcQ family protein [Agromyces sp. LY-1074]MDR5706837.1 BtpA/SgcQ family protein [Agromyces sp. LY-1358]